MRSHSRVKRTSLLAASLVLLSAACQDARAQQRVLLVQEVVVEGNRRLTEEEIFGHIKTRPGRPYSERRARSDLQTLLNLGLFDTTETRVSIEHGARGMVVIFTVTELPLLREVKFEGLVGIEEAEVVETLRAEKINLFAGAVYDPVRVRRAVAAIQRFLAERGQPNSAVEITTKIGGTYASVEVKITHAP